MPTHPTAFVSYSWDDDVHKEWGKALATRLRGGAADVRLDQWHSVPGNRLTHFMETEISQNDFVIIIAPSRQDGSCPNCAVKGKRISAAHIPPD